MELALFIWFAGVTGGLKIATIILSIFGMIILAVVLGATAGDNVKIKWKVKTTILSCIFIFGIILPSERTLWLMAAGYTAQTVVQSETGKKLHKLVDSKLDEMLSVAEKQLDKAVPVE